MQIRRGFPAFSTVCTLVLAAFSLPAQAGTFIDSTVQIIGRPNVVFGDFSFVAPFARLTAPNALQGIRVGHQSNIQDNVEINASNGPVTIGDRVILAHGSTVKGTAAIGTTGTCPVAGQTLCPTFVSFNAVIDGATIQKDAMVSALARVGPGVTIPSGRKVLSGANVATNAQVPSKTVAVTAADRLFMDGVIAVNVEFARAYPELAALGIDKVRGISVNPVTPFNPVEVEPTIGGVATVNPAFRNRIIGDVRIGNTLAELDQRMASNISLRADEGSPFDIGSIASMGGRTTFHALEGTNIVAGTDGRYGAHSVVHGGGSVGETVAGNGVTVGEWAVLFRSRVGDGSSIGFRSLVQQAVLLPGTIVPACTVIIGTAAPTRVEWCNLTP